MKLINKATGEPVDVSDAGAHVLLARGTHLDPNAPKPTHNAPRAAHTARKRTAKPEE